MADSSASGPSFFGKLKAFGDRIENVAYNLGDSVASAGSKVVVAVKDLPHNIIDGFDGGDFDRIKSINELARTQNVKAKKYSAKEWEEAEKRADEVLATLYSGYTVDDFDPVKYELEQLTPQADHEEIENVVEKLTTCVEKATGKLARHVFKKRDTLLEGINTVASIEDDLKAAFMIARTSRTSLKQSAEEIMRNLRVAGQTRRKQGYLNLMEVVLKVKKIRDLQQTLKQAQEMGEYGEAILLCVQCFQGVESLKALKVASELRATVQRLYVETLQHVDQALTVICSQFDPTRYSKVLEAYMLQGIQGKHLAEKVLQCFKDAIYDATMRVVRSLLLTKPKIVEKLAGGILEGSYAGLCACLSVDLLRPCLLKEMEVLFDILASYHVMARWHVDCLQQQGSLDVPVPAPEEHPEEPAQQPVIAFLTCVSHTLATSRAEVFDMAAQRVVDLVNMPGLFKGEDFVQVVEWGQKFLGMGEAFMGQEAAQLRATLAETTASFFDAYHRGNVESLLMLLQNEMWKNAARSGPNLSINLEEAITCSPLYVPPFSDEAAVRDFDQWLLQGNPFTRGPHDASKQQAMMSLLRPSVSASATSETGSETSARMRPDVSEFSMAADDAEQQQGMSSLSSWLGTPTASPSSRLAKEDIARSRELRDAPGEPSGQDGRAAGPPGDGSRAIITVSSGQALKFIQAYGQLMRPMSSRAVSIFQAMCDLFDNYLLSCFILFSGITLEVLVLQDDVIPTRLHSAVMRILTMPHSRYKSAVEELVRLKPLDGSRHPSSSTHTGISFLDRFTNKMESLATDLERSVDRMQQRINENVQLPAAITSIASEVAKAVERVDALAAQGSTTSGRGRGLYGLHERIAATESLMHMADELKAGRQALLACLPRQHQRDAEQYFSPTGTLEAARDLRDTLFRGAARKLLAALLDEHGGTAQQIATTNYNLREPLLVTSPWVDHCVRCYTQFRDLISGAGLPANAVLQVWDNAVITGAEAIVDGLSQIRRCTFEGRASMSYDLSHVERSVRGLAPKGFSGSFRTADDYIKAYYLPWGELARWCQVRLAEYGKYRITALVELIADAYKVKRSQKKELLQHIEEFSREFTQQ